MKIRLLVSRVTNEGAENRGDIIEVSAAEAESMIAAEQAELLTADTPERAAGRGKKAETRGN